MTEAEFTERQKEILEKVPPEFWGNLSYYAYYHGHSSGYEEILSYLDDIVEGLKDPIKNFEHRLTSKS